MKRVIALIILAAGMSLAEEKPKPPAPAPAAPKLTEKQKLEIYRLMLDATTTELMAKRKAEVVQGKLNELASYCGSPLMRNKDGDLDCPEKSN